MIKVYFAHPQNTYGTKLEKECLEAISKNFPDYEIVNPSDQIHKDAIAQLRVADPGVNVMPYFEGLVERCTDLVALPFGDGMWGAGVHKEALVAKNNSSFLWEISPVSKEISFVPDLPEQKKLSVEDTRLRIRYPDGSSKRFA